MQIKENNFFRILIIISYNKEGYICFWINTIKLKLFLKYKILFLVRMYIILLVVNYNRSIITVVHK